jgi:hypothetical protein
VLEYCARFRIAPRGCWVDGRSPVLKPWAVFLGLFHGQELTPAAGVIAANQYHRNIENDEKPALYLLLRAPFLERVFPVAALLLRAALLACLASALWETLFVGSRFNARTRALLRLGDGLTRPVFAFSKSCFAFVRVASDVRALAGGGSLTPARRAFESPIAIACCADRAPCLPRRISSISS